MSITIASAEAAVAATPYLLGFTPQDSLVLLLLDEEGLRVSLRVDLPAGADLSWLRSVLGGIPEPVPEGAVLIGYADAASAEYVQAAAMWLTHVLLPVLEVVDVVLVSDGRVMSALDGGPVDSSGTPLDQVRDHPVVAECVAAGLTCVPRREDLVFHLRPVSDAVSERVADALRRGVITGVDYERRRDRLEQRATNLLQGAEDLDPADVATLAEACRDVHVRDPLMALVLDAHARGAGVSLSRVRTRLTYALVHLPDTHAGPVAATLALVAWADGDGAAALVAADRAVELDPQNTLAPLIAQALQHGMPPTTWSKLTSDIPLEVLRGRARRSA